MSIREGSVDNASIVYYNVLNFVTEHEETLIPDEMSKSDLCRIHLLPHGETSELPSETSPTHKNRTQVEK